MCIHFVRTQEYVFVGGCYHGSIFTNITGVNSDNSVFILNLKFRTELLEDQQYEIVVFVLSTSR